MCRLKVEVLPVGVVDPLGTIPVTREYDRVDDAVIVEDTDFEVSV